MRPAPTMTFGILGLLICATCGYSGEPPQRKPGVAPKRLVVAPARPAPEKSQPLTVTGWGQTHEDAELNALKRAQDKLLEYFAERRRYLAWRPNLDYINNNLVKDRDAEPTQNFGDVVGDLQGVSLRLEVSAKDWQYMLREDRRVHAESRMLLLAKLLAGLVAILGAVGGYLRLEEMTKGYYTTWLRLAATSFVTAVGAGIWWVSLKLNL